MKDTFLTMFPSVAFPMQIALLAVAVVVSFGILLRWIPEARRLKLSFVGLGAALIALGMVVVPAQSVIDFAWGSPEKVYTSDTAETLGRHSEDWTRSLYVVSEDGSTRELDPVPQGLYTWVASEQDAQMVTETCSFEWIEPKLLSPLGRAVGCDSRPHYYIPLDWLKQKEQS